jgi:hypothetical protein
LIEAFFDIERDFIIETEFMINSGQDYQTDREKCKKCTIIKDEIILEKFRMGIKSQKEKFNHFKTVNNSLKFSYGEDTFRITGKIKQREDIEALSRIFYKKFEELLYSKIFLNKIYEHAVKKVLKMNKIYNKSFFDVLKSREFNFEAINILIIKIFDYVYYTVRKKLPYSKKLGAISKTINELLENTFLYSTGDFSVTSGIMKEYPQIIIKYENKYDKSDEKMNRNIEKLKLVVNEVNSIELSNDAIMNINKRIEHENDPYPGLLKIKMHTGTKISFSNNSSHFGNDGITLTFILPMELYTEKEIYNEFNNLIKSQ